MFLISMCIFTLIPLDLATNENTVLKQLYYYMYKRFFFDFVCIYVFVLTETKKIKVVWEKKRRNIILLKNKIKRKEINDEIDWLRDNFYIK